MARKQPTSNPKPQTGSSRLLAEPAAIMGPRLLFILSVIALCILGLVMVYSASSITAYNEFGDAAYYVKRQAIFLVIGLVFCAICSRIPYSVWSLPAVFITFWAISVVMLSLTAFGMGVTALGAERSIVIAGFNLQPAEFAKIAVLIAVASIVQMRINGLLEGRRFIVVILVATIVPLILIYRQPDLGTAIILAVGLIALALLAGISWKVVGLILGVVVAYIVVACITQPYHLDRITSMLDPWVDPQGDGYQAIQSLYAFGSGGIFGTGLGLSRQKYLYLPYAHTDFIYAIVGEELGLIGAVFVVVLFGLFVFAGMRICRNAPDMLGCMLAGSFTVMIGFQACVNMACVTGIAPVTGKALPLISYGGSSLLATLIMVGIVLSVSFRSKVGMSYERKRDNFVVIDGKGDAHDDAPPRRPARDNVISIHDSGKRRGASSAHVRSSSTHGEFARSMRVAGQSGATHASGEPVQNGYASLRSKRDSGRKR